MVRVLIERQLVRGTEDAFRTLMRGMRKEAVYATGYIAGETLRDVSDHTHYVVISTWHTRQDWDAWAVSAARETVRDLIRPMLTAEERTTILEPV